MSLFPAKSKPENRAKANHIEGLYQQTSNTGARLEGVKLKNDNHEIDRQLCDKLLEVINKEI